MTYRSKTARGTTDLCIGEFVGFCATFLRYIILARFLGVSDFGIAATLTLTVQVLQTISNMAMNRLIVQSRNGEDQPLLATAHSLQVLRGIVSALLLLALAWPVSSLFGIPHARWAFEALALAPLLEGLLHLDMHRMERHMNFRPAISVGAIPKLIAAIAAWPVAAWFQDYSAGLWLIIVQGVAAVLISHAVAKRPYRLAWDNKYLREILEFGWPLLLNGVLFFTISQGDRLIVGTAYTMADLGVFSVSVGLVMTINGALFNIVNTITLPPLSRAQDEPKEFLRRYRICVIIFSLIAGVVGSLLIVAGEPLVVIFYGEPYRAAGVLVGWLAAAQSLRILRLGPSLAAMAKGDTRCLMFANIFRVSGIAAAAAVGFAGKPLSWIAAAAVVGEIVAFPIPIVWLSIRHRLPARVCLQPAFSAIALIILSGLVVAAGARHVAIITGLIALLIAITAVLVWGLFAYAKLRGHLVSLLTLLGLSGETPTEREADSR